MKRAAHWVRTLGAVAAVLWLLIAASPANAQSPHEPPPPDLSAPPTATLSAPPGSVVDPMGASAGKRSDEKKMLGVMLDVGLPDGTVASFVVRPISLLRLHAGVGYNAVSPGLRLGAALLPFGAGPSVSLDYGHYFEGDANSLAQAFTGANKADSVLLERFGYDYLSLRAGMELGGDRFIFFSRGGVSWVRTTIHEFATLLDPGEGQAATNTSIVVSQDPILSAFVPTFQIGMIVRL